eukprot:TRINITY_DN16045_c0_g2_i2.p1 TRINITY_DN16045_c0_g2~~TRINITY_DN16045_c0_g2_i2.p1  ORF type:complete len:238 (+),score=44.23 TRINITY_DN16045_c0_g2_i2:91-714(+)
MSVNEMLLAASAGDIVKVKHMLDKGVSVEAGCLGDVRVDNGVIDVFKKGTTALHAACWGAHADLVQTLINYTNHLGPTDCENRTPLQIAAGIGRKTVNEVTRVSCMKIIKSLLMWGAVFRTTDWGGMVVTRTSKEWQHDDTVLTCPGPECGVTFGVFTRKHHCRCCGKIFCDYCAPDSEEYQGRACPYCRAVTKLWKARIMLSSTQE